MDRPPSPATPAAPGGAALCRNLSQFDPNYKWHQPAARRDAADRWNKLNSGFQRYPKVGSILIHYGQTRIQPMQLNCGHLIVHTINLGSTGGLRCTLCSPPPLFGPEAVTVTREACKQPPVFFHTLSSSLAPALPQESSARPSWKHQN